MVGASVEHYSDVTRHFRFGDPTPDVSDSKQDVQVGSGAMIKRGWACRGHPCLSLEPHPPLCMLKLII